MEIDWPSLAVAAIGVGIASAAWLETRKARKAADRSAKAAEQSAQESARLTQIESGRRLDEVTARHDVLGPPHPGEIATVVESGINGQSSLFGTFSVPREYYVQVEGWTGTSTTPVVGFPSHVDANKVYRFHIEHWPKGRATPQTEEVRFRFWPPHPNRVQGHNWTCPCDGPADEVAGASGHWQLRVPIKPPVIPFIRHL